MNAEKSFGEFLDELYASRFTGTITLDVFNGVPRAVALPGPKVAFARPVKRKEFDKRTEVADAVSV